MWNEEKIKNNIILPFLFDCGFNPNELSFEDQFTIALGRGRFNVNGREQRIANGRLDILCKRDSDNLCVIEVKAEGVNLTDDDRVQGLTYARLMEPMAPFVIVTNGSKTKVFNTISGEEVEKPYSSNWTISGIQSEIELRYEALHQFLGMSLDNLLTFCNLHNERQLSIFKSSKVDDYFNKFDKKYISELYVNRDIAEESFELFVNQHEKSTFALIGDAGTGKTNTMLNFVDSYQLNNPILFYSGTLLNGSLFKKIQRDFNRFFSSEESTERLFKKISYLIRKHRKPLFLVIDAIDEWDSTDKVQQLNELSEVCNDLGIKLCISCKTDYWNTFIKHKGVNTLLSQNIYPVSCLSIFNSNESRIALQKYSEVFKIDITGAEDIKELKNPFFLRVTSEVCFLENKALSNNSSTRETYKRYISKKLEKHDSPDVSMKLLVGVASALIKIGNPQIEEDKLNNLLNLNIDQILPARFFADSILYKYTDLTGRSMIGFYFSGIRDYILSVLCLKLDLFSNEERENIIKQQGLINYVAESSTKWFFKTGDINEKKDILHAVIKHDIEFHTCILPKLLGLPSGDLDVIFVEQNQVSILEHFKILFINNRSNLNRLNEIIDTVSYFKKNEEIEGFLVELFEIIADGNDGSTCAYKLANLLTAYNGEKNTNRLLALLLDNRKDDYVRRYIVESLHNRSGIDKKDVFKKLLYYKNPNVSTWISSWYFEIEEIELRNELIDIVNGSNVSLALNAIRYLNYSSLSDTPDLLIDGLKKNRYENELEGWIYRCLAKHNAEKSIPLMLDQITKKTGRVKEQIIISLGELQAVEALPVLLKIVESPGISPNLFHWIPSSVAQICKGDSAILLKAIDNKSIHYTEFLILTFIEMDENVPINLIDNFINSKEVSMESKLRILTRWEGIKTDKELELLYKCFELDDGFTSVIISHLINSENNVKRLAAFMKKVIPSMNQSLTTNKVLIINKSNLDELANYLKPWLHSQLLLSNNSETTLKTILVLLALLGDHSSIEVMKTREIQIVKRVGKDFFEDIEYALYSNDKWPLLIG